MNEAVQEKWGWATATHAMRDEVINALTDADLAFTPGGDAMTFGALCREMGEIEKAYADSFKNFTQTFSYRHPDHAVETSVDALKAWFKQLDAEAETAIGAIEDGQKIIKRDSGYETPVLQQLEFYLQALLIFLGKATIYLRAMKKPLSSDMIAWVG